MFQPSAFHDGSLGILMRQPGAVRAGSLGVLMAQPGAVRAGTLGLWRTSPAEQSQYRARQRAAALRMARRASLDAAARAQVAAQAAHYHGLGATSAAQVAARTTAATGRGICLNRCAGQRTGKPFAGCVKKCTRQYPLHGLGETPMPQWAWIAGSVALVGVVGWLAMR